MDIREKKIGFFGLGNMGLPMCQGMVKDGWKIVLPTFRPARSPERQAAIEAMLTSGAEGSASQVEMIEKCDMFVLSLPKSQQVEDLVLGADGILAHGKPGTIIVDATSADPMSTKKLAATLQAAGMDIIDCPVSGGVGGAANQTLTIMVGGRRETFEYCLPILNTLGNPDKVMYIGPSGAGDMIKCANNFLSACCAAATTEAVAGCGKAGIDPQTAIKVISSSGGASNASTNKFPNLFFPGKKWNFALELMYKDIGLFNATAKELNVPAFFGQATAQIWNIPIAEVGGKEDCIHVQNTYERWSGTKMCGITEEKK